MKPARLDKKTTPEEKLEAFLLGNAHIFIPIIIIIGMILFAALCYAIVGVSATESGVKYNHIMDVI